MAIIRETPSGVTLTVSVHPRARKNAITGQLGDTIERHWHADLKLVDATELH